MGMVLVAKCVLSLIQPAASAARSECAHLHFALRGFEHQHVRDRRVPKLMLKTVRP